MKELRGVIVSFFSVGRGPKQYVHSEENEKIEVKTQYFVMKYMKSMPW